jgi:hypothetical protein
MAPSSSESLGGATSLAIFNQRRRWRLNAQDMKSYARDEDLTLH